jgi:hypothetical protein
MASWNRPQGSSLTAEQPTQGRGQGEWFGARESPIGLTEQNRRHVSQLSFLARVPLWNRPEPHDAPQERLVDIARYGPEARQSPRDFLAHITQSSPVHAAACDRRRARTVRAVSVLSAHQIKKFSHPVLRSGWR